MYTVEMDGQFFLHQVTNNERAQSDWIRIIPLQMAPCIMCVQYIGGYHEDIGGIS